VIVFLGMDDTGQPGKCGTADLALELGLALQAGGFARLLYVSMHRLLAHCEETPGASVNQAACLTLEAEPPLLREIEMESRVYINRNYCAGANPGFALADPSQVNQRILSYAKACRMLVMDPRDALELARGGGIAISALAGSGRGIIGALAAIGWRWQGSDGVISWMPGLAQLKGVMTLSEILHVCTFDLVKSVRGKTPFFEDRIQLGEGVTPLLKDGHTLLLLEAAPRNAAWDWTAIGLEDAGRINW